jgi:hypothetical protein
LAVKQFVFGSKKASYTFLTARWKKKETHEYILRQILIWTTSSSGSWWTSCE